MRPIFSRTIFATSFFAATLLAFVPSSIAAKPKSEPESKSGPAFYDEIRDEKGNLRPQYKNIYPIYQNMNQQDRAEFMTKAKKDFQEDNTLNPLPRIITQSEYDLIRKGIEQRAKGLLMFLQDYYGGGDSWKKAVPEQALKRIIARSGEEGFKGILKPEQIAFPYGPDIVRRADGSWGVFEDNPGYIGGIGDLKAATEILFKNQPGYKNVLPVKYDPMDFYKTWVKRAQEAAIPKGGKIVIYMVPPYPDNEDLRIKAIFKDLGVEVITPNTKNRLIVNDQGVFIRSNDKIGSTPLERVGYTFINGEHWWVDATHPLTRKRAILFEAQSHLDEKTLDKNVRQKLLALMEPNSLTKEPDYAAIEKTLGESNFLNEFSSLRRNSIDGLIGAISKGQVAVNYSFGVDFIGDKEFGYYVPEIIKNYLHEEPILKSLDAELVTKFDTNGKESIREDLMTEIFKKGGYKNKVIKVVDGRGGDGIYLGPEIKPNEISEIEQIVRRRPDAYKIEAYTSPSRMEDIIVDLRGIASVSSHGIDVSPVLWGRGVPHAVSGKVNLSIQNKDLSKSSREVMIIVVDDPISCEAKKIKSSLK